MLFPPPLAAARLRSSPGAKFSLESISMHAGMLYATLAYAIWGLFPLYFKALHDVPPAEVVLHRIVWSLGFLTLVLLARRQWSWIGGVLRQPRVLIGFAASALLLSANWFLYIWAVHEGRVADAALGYFINPLVNVLLGFVFLRERMRVLQWAAIALAAIGVGWLTWQGGSVPWIALILAVTFGGYGLLRKTATLGALEGLSLETLILFPPALVYLAVLAANDSTAFGHAALSTKWLLAAAGPITAVPLLLFAAGARRIPLSVLGLLQYSTPSLQLLLAIWLYHEPFGQARAIGFALIWGALAVYSLEGLWQGWRAKRESGESGNKRE
jgi:chloramphenicol-sensitive protein RarD